MIFIKKGLLNKLVLVITSMYVNLHMIQNIYIQDANMDMCMDMMY